jgi:hypothetical protein
MNATSTNTLSVFHFLFVYISLMLVPTSVVFDYSLD